jgi:hypothetical protein
VTDINPKDAAALKKVPMHLLPDVGVVYGAMACLDGALKYGPYNWRERSISLMLYIGALKRHIAALEGGEDDAKDSKLPHLAHVVATASILLDAKEAGALIDDRPKRQADVAGLIERMNAVVAARVDAPPVQAEPYARTQQIRGRWVIEFDYGVHEPVWRRTNAAGLGGEYGAQADAQEALERRFYNGSIANRGWWRVVQQP